MWGGGGGGGGGHSSCNASQSQSNVQKNSRTLVKGMGGLNLKTKYIHKKKLGIFSPVFCTFSFTPSPKT